MKSYFEHVYFKELYYDNLDKFTEGEEKLKNGTELYTAGLARYKKGKALYENKTRAFEEAKKRRENYLDIKFSFDEEKIKEADRLKKEGEIRIRNEYGLSLEEFFLIAPKRLEEGRLELENGAKKLKIAKKQLQDGKLKLDDGAVQLANGRKKLDTVGDVIWGITNSLVNI